MNLIKILNLFAGIGGNRFYWDDFPGLEITAIDNNPEVAHEYSILFPQDELLITGAWDYVEKNYKKYDIIWASPPCQTHSFLSRANSQAKHKRLPDFRLYSLIIFLQEYFKGSYIIENVRSYYKPLIKPQHIGRHYFWSNLLLEKVDYPHFNLKPRTGKTTVVEYLENIQNWLGIKLSKRIYLNGNHAPGQIYRNCVHTILGRELMKQLISKTRKQTLLIDFVENS